jgi:hypothetical protein
LARKHPRTNSETGFVRFGAFWWLLVGVSVEDLFLVCSSAFWWVLVGSAGFWSILVVSNAFW